MYTYCGINMFAYLPMKILGFPCSRFFLMTKGCLYLDFRLAVSEATAEGRRHADRESPHRAQPWVGSLISLS